MGAFHHAGIEPGRQLTQRLAARGPESNADERGVALARDVAEWCVAVAAHVKAVTLLLEIEQAVVKHELACCSRIGVTEDHIFDVVDKHWVLLGIDGAPPGRNRSPSPGNGMERMRGGRCP